jgi:CRP/FNR family transcriptional regulator, nitrogen fixation regulation protein
MSSRASEALQLHYRTPDGDQPVQTQPLTLAQAPGPIFGARSPCADDDIRVIGFTKTFAKDQQIFCEGSSTDFIYRVVSGGVRSTRLFADGRRHISDFYLPGDVFGVELDAARLATAEALGETVLVVARRSSLAPESDPSLCRHALRELRRCQDHVLNLGRRGAAERIASFLIDLARRLDADDAFDLPMNRQDIADYLGLTIETVSRTMTQFDREGLIALKGCRRIRLRRPAALADLCD